MNTYIKHGPKGLGKVIDTVDDFVKFVKCFGNNGEPSSEVWEFELVTMTEKEFSELPEFEGF